MDENRAWQFALFLFAIVLMFVGMAFGAGFQYGVGETKKEARNAGVGDWYLDGNAEKQWQWIDVKNEVVEKEDEK